MNTDYTSNKPLDYFPPNPNTMKFLTSWWWVNLIWLKIKTSKRRNVQHNRKSISMYLMCIISNFTIFSCILVHYICITGTFIFLLCSNFDHKNVFKTWALPSTSATYLVLLPNWVWIFIQCERFFIRCYARCLWNTVYSRSLYSFQRK